MQKSLGDMTLEELWHLFPISLVPHRDEWAVWYADAAQSIKAVLPPSYAVGIYHIGSTAIPGIYAKNIVDILLICPDSETLGLAADLLSKAGWIVMSRSDRRISLNLGYTEQGFAERVFHLHLRLPGDDDEIYFRDYLIAHPDVAKAYQELKLSLADRFRYNRDAYTEAKTAFILRYTNVAKMIAQ